MSKNEQKKMDETDTSDTECWQVDTLDVDQADAHLLETPGQSRIMIDVDEDQIVDTLDSLDTWGETESTSRKIIDEFVTTHIHDDHIAGVQYLKDGGYTVQQAYRPSADRYKLDEKGGVDRTVLEKYLEGLAEQGIDPYEIEPINSGDTILDEEDATLTALSPPPTDETIETASQSTGYPCKFKPEKANGNGAVCKFEGTDGVSGLFMGDVGDESAHNAESWLVQQHNDSERDVDLDADLLYLGHHGSNNATGEKFLDAVDPEHVVVSSGLDNNYTSENQHDGHPHDETLERLHERDVQTHWTAVHGTTTTTVEDGTVQLNHENPVETTAATDITALKYYGRANDLDQEELAEIETIEPDAMPEETPDWAAEASLLTEETTIDTDRIDALHALEVEHRKLKQKKRRLEHTHDHRLEQKNDLQQRGNDQGLTDRLTTAVSSLWDTEDADEKNTEHASEQDESHTDPSQQAETDTGDPDQWEDIEAAIDAYKQRNTALRADVRTLSGRVEALTEQIETLKAETNDGLVQRVVNAVGTQDTDQQPTETTPETTTDSTAPQNGQPDSDFTTTDPESRTQPDGSTDPNDRPETDANERSKWLGPPPPENAPEWLLDADDQKDDSREDEKAESNPTKEKDNSPSGGLGL